MLEKIKENLEKLHKELFNSNLVAWTSGNISEFSREDGLVVIKPSGVKYKDLKIEKFVVVDLEGNKIEGDMNPSTDTESHLYIYKNSDEVNGIVHTHSTYATAFCANRRPIPCYLTAQADEFGGEIPCAEYSEIGGKEIGMSVVECLKNTKSKSILLANHGVFSVGESADAALKSAVMTEDCAKTAFWSINLGNPLKLSEEEIFKNWDRYQGSYGQKE
tara:strand:+ start:3081 stop:3734 length:654 start_codon:yes stop_codon:yes gene_type:complete